jgi:hypothetical protein
VTVAPVALAIPNAPPAVAQTTPTIPLPTTTSTTVAPATTTTTPAGSKTPPKPTTSTTSSKSTPTGVPAVPVGVPPTTAPPAGAKPAPQPDPTPILTQVDGELDQLTAISDYQPARTLVAQAQDVVTQAGAALLSDRQALDAAHTAQGQAQQAKATADSKLRQLAVAAYIGVGFTSPGLDQPAQGNGDQGAGTVSTPDGLTGITAIDAREMLVIVGQHARQSVAMAGQTVNLAAKATKNADNTYHRAQATVSAAEAHLLAAQQTLKLVTTAAITPGAASATPLPNLLSTTSGTNNPPGAGQSPVAAPAPTTTTTTTTTTPAIPGSPVSAATGTPPASPAILGPSALNASQLAAWWATLNRKPNVTVPIEKLIASYAKWGTQLGVSYDVAFAQSIIETGYFTFPAGGQLTGKDNNFAGIGACDSCSHGWTFPDADTGVLAQIELLHLYASNQGLPTGVKNVIGGTGVGGCCDTWTKLAGKWATSTVYGISIMTVYQQMLAWLIPQAELGAVLIAPTNPAAKGPSLAPLPGGKTPGTTTTTRPGVSSASLKR